MTEETNNIAWYTLPHGLHEVYGIDKYGNRCIAKPENIQEIIDQAIQQERVRSIKKEFNQTAKDWLKKQVQKGIIKEWAIAGKDGFFVRFNTKNDIITLISPIGEERS